MFFLLGGGYVKPHQPLSLRVSNFLGCWGYARARMPRNRPPWLLLLVGSWSRGGVLEVVKIVQIAHPKKRAPARARMPRNPPAWWCYSLAPGRSPRAAASCRPAVGRAEAVRIAQEEAQGPRRCWLVSPDRRAARPHLCQLMAAPRLCQ